MGQTPSKDELHQSSNKPESFRQKSGETDEQYEKDKRQWQEAKTSYSTFTKDKENDAGTFT